MAGFTVAPSAAEQVAGILKSDELRGLIAELDELQWTGRKGYGAKALLGACLVKSLYAIPTWTRTARLIAEHRGLQDALGGAPSQWACYRFSVKLRENRPALNTCLDALAASLRAQHPEMGRDVAIDASDLAAYGNGQRYVSKGGKERERFSDPDASWGHRSAISTRKGGGFYGFKIDACVDVATGLPLAWKARTAREAEQHAVVPLLDTLAARGFAPQTCAMDAAYDYGPVHDACMERGVLPITALHRTTAKTQDDTPECEHGRWHFAGADFKRGASKWRCPTGQCEPKSKWVKANRRNPLVPRGSKRFGSLYRGRGAIEREFGRLKHEYGLVPLRTRGLERVALHADLCILAQLSQALARARAVPLAA